MSDIPDNAAEVPSLPRSLPASDVSAVEEVRMDDAMDIDHNSTQDVVRMITAGDTVGLQTGDNLF